MFEAVVGVVKSRILLPTPLGLLAPELTNSQLKDKFAITDGGDTHWQWLLDCRIQRWRDRQVLLRAILHDGRS